MSLSLYSAEQEENAYIRRQAKIWLHSGLITYDQLRDINDNSETGLNQANLFFRILFFIFTLLCAGALTGLFVWLTRGDGRITSIAVTLILFGIGYYIAAEYFVISRQFYRHGIEEALALIAMAFFCLGCFMLMQQGAGNNKEISIVTSALIALAALWIYLRFGYLDAALISIIALGTIPLQFSASPVNKRLLLTGVLCVILLFCLATDRSDREEYKKEKMTILQAYLLAALYLTVNLEIISLFELLQRNARIAQVFPPAIYWSSYVLTFLLPAAGIYWGIKSRKRYILNASLIMACITLATNKSYLGMTRYAWDPAILGIVLIVLSISIARWIKQGPNSRRYGFTTEDILKPEDQGISLTDVAAAITPGAIDAIQPQTTRNDFFKGGSSGGGGADREY